MGRFLLLHVVQLLGDDHFLQHPAMISKITAMNGSRRMLIDEKLKLEKNISENLTGMVSNETLELYEQIESVILQTHQGMDHAKAEAPYFGVVLNINMTEGSNDTKTCIANGQDKCFTKSDYTMPFCATYVNSDTFCARI